MTMGNEPARDLEPAAPQNHPLPAATSAAPPTPFGVYDIAGAKARLAGLKQFFNEVMIEGPGQDYGTIPGTDRKTLFKAGAEKLCEFYQFIQRPKVTHRVETWEPKPFFHYEVELDLLDRRTGAIVGTGLGSCNSMESRYRWRHAERVCPECKTPAIIKGKPEYGGGFVCFKRKDGCGAKFAEDDPRILDQPVGRVENDDIFSLVNTILKMGKKRALTDAVVGVTRSAGLLVEPGDDDDDDEVPRGGQRTNGKTGTGTAAPLAEMVSEEQQKMFYDTATKAGHKREDVVGWLKAQGIDLSKGRIPKDKYGVLLERIAKKESLVAPAGESGKLV
jgi:hypothetical protein